MPIEDRELAVAAAEAGAAVVRRHFGTAGRHTDKGGGDFATIADVEAERAITGVLRAARPGDAVLGEESGRSGAGGDARLWLVDPLCGTLNYAVRSMLVGVNVALRVDGVTTAAAVADPFGEEVFVSGGGRAGLRRAGVEQPLVPSAGSTLVDLNLDPPFPNAASFSAAALLTDPAFAGRWRPRVVSTTLALTWVAAGRRAAYVTDGHLGDSVHFAAPIAVCEAAGCVVSDLRGEPVHSGAGGLVAAADRATHDALLTMIRRQG